MVHFTDHSLERMEKYAISRENVMECLEMPDRITEGYLGRLVAEKAKNGYILRVVYETIESQKIIITVYMAKKDRYWSD